MLRIVEREHCGDQSPRRVQANECDFEEACQMLLAEKTPNAIVNHLMESGYKVGDALFILYASRRMLRFSLKYKKF